MSRFAEALRASATPVVMELKRATADGTDLFRGRTAHEIAERFRALGAPCLSVVTGSWFGGDERLLREVAATTDLPLLMKDFVTCERHVEHAAELGASALLLTAALLPVARVRRLVALSQDHGLTPFVEISDESPLDGLVDPARCMVAISNKQIRTRECGAADFARGRTLLAPTRAAGAGCVVSASGIQDPTDGARLLAAGFDGLLVGTALLTAADPQRWLSRLRAAHVG